MIKKFLEVGKIVNTHGVKGELKVDPWCDTPQFLKKLKVIYLDAAGSKKLNVVSSRVHGNMVLMQLSGITTMEQATALRNKIIFMDRKDAHLDKNSYFIQDLIGCKVFDADDKDKCYGEICEVSQTGANDVWHIKQGDKEYLIPAIPLVVISTDVENELVFIRPLKGIFDDED